ncbi:CRE-FPN-1.2 protein [Caenorhabditis remanei]|uniref:Solute carrier family 40 member n=1 Tax=Caenorhabditis remanei TaxID=31234 RepID=E3LZY5_CAERE|nr:CRE-FPN-1.2 protein [Caenorhabditis remanei]
MTFQQPSPQNNRRTSGTLSRTSIFLYCAYISTCLEDRAWSFCVSLCMVLMGGMRVVSIEQLFEGVLQMILSGYLGKLFDGLSRKRAILTVVPLNNLSICAAAGLIITCLSIDATSPWYIMCLVLAMCMCAVNRLFLNAEKFITSRDWVMVLGDDRTLSNMNATLLTLDQFTNVIAPLFTGALVTWVGLRETVGIFGIASLVSMTSKSIFLRLIYISNPLLQVKKDKKEEITTDPFSNSRLNESVVKTYWRQASFSAAFGMALLFMTVMGFDGLAVGYGSSAGLPEFIIGAFRSFGSLTAILGAFSYAFFEKRYSVATSGLLGLVVQQFFAMMAVVSVFLPGSPMDLGGYFGNFTAGGWWHDMVHSFNGNNGTNFDPHVDWNHFSSDGVSLVSIFVFLIAIASARYGLWCLDLAITHIMQVTVPERERNTVFGMHNALCNTFSVLKDVLVIILPLPATFAICIFISYGFVTVGHMFFVYYLVKTNSIWTVGRRISQIEEKEQTEEYARL